MCKFVNIGKEIEKEVLKKTPPAFFIGIDAIIGIDNSYLSYILNSDEEVIAQIAPLSRKKRRMIYIYLDRIEKKRKKNKEVIKTILHELVHNFEIYKGSFWPGIYAANEIYRKREEEKADKISGELFIKGHI